MIVIPSQSLLHIFNSSKSLSYKSLSLVRLRLSQLQGKVGKLDEQRGVVSSSGRHQVKIETKFIEAEITNQLEFAQPDSR